MRNPDVPVLQDLVILHWAIMTPAWARCRTIHHIDAQHVKIPLQELNHLIVLQILIAGGVQNIHMDANPISFFRFLGKFFDLRLDLVVLLIRPQAIPH